MLKERRRHRSLSLSGELAPNRSSGADRASGGRSSDGGAPSARFLYRPAPPYCVCGPPRFLLPRSRTALRHWHEQQDEFVIVITGEVVLREEEGETILRDGDCAGFKSGVANGHAFENRSNGPVILFEIGTRTEDETVHYPDVDLRYEKRGTSRTFLHKDGTPYSE